MPTPDEHAAARKRIAVATAAVAADRWERVDPDAISQSWSAQLPTVTAALSAAQFAVADEAEDYLDEFAEPADVMVDPSGFSGTASDGGGLASLLYQPAITALMSIGSGADVDRALAGGGASLDMIVRTQVADAGRAADQAALAARPSVQGYVRQIVGATCARCTILAGRFYRWNAGFQRHPRCDCIHVPASRAQWREAGRFHDPQQVYDSLSVAQRQRAGWSLADQQAIADGADLITTTNMKGVTTAGTRRSVGKLTPDQIYKRAAGNRDEAIRLLRQNGYLRGAPVVRTTRVATRSAQPKVLPRTEIGRTTVSGGMIAKTEMVEYADGVRVIQKTAKAIEGTSARHQQDAEELGAALLRALGLRAPEVRRLTAARIEMELIDGAVPAAMQARAFSAATREESRRILDEYLSLIGSDQGIRMGLADVLMDNYDRNKGNWILTARGEMAGIDHGLSWQRLEKFREAPSVQGGLDGWHTEPSGHFAGRHGATPGHGQWADNALTLDDVRRVRTQLRSLRDDFVRLDREDWYEYMFARLDFIEAHARGTRNLIVGVT